MDIRPGTVLAGPGGKTITIEALIGAGGFGQVFSAKLSDGSPVAVKTVATGALNAEALRTLQNEAKHAAEIVQPNVVRVLFASDGDTPGGQPPYLVTEFVAGGTLRALIEKKQSERTSFTASELRELYLQIAEGMAAVNAKSVHRDLKPENVLIETDGTLKVTDFGLAKLADAATRSETFKGWGTRAYQAPEAFDGGPNTTAMDVYSGGIMFFEMAALTRPIEPKPGDVGPMAWRRAHLLSPPKDLRTLRADLPGDLIQLIVQMLGKDPSKRPASFSAIIDRLRTSPPSPGTPDISALVNKATATLIQTSAAETKAREERERRAERQALLEMAFQEPVIALKSVVMAFNDASAVGKLQWHEIGAMSAEVRSGSARPRMSAQAIDDLDARPNGIVRVIGVVQLEPTPTPRDANDAIRDRESFGSFNLVYRAGEG